MPTQTEKICKGCQNWLIHSSLLMRSRSLDCRRTSRALPEAVLPPVSLELLQDK